jgi:hypothetical protein
MQKISNAVLFLIFILTISSCQSVQLLKRQHRKGFTIQKFKKTNHSLAFKENQSPDIKSIPQINSKTPVLSDFKIKLKNNADLKETIEEQFDRYEILNAQLKNDTIVNVSDTLVMDPLGSLAYGFGLGSSIMGAVGLATGIFSTIGELGIFIFILSFWPAIFGIIFGIVSVYRIDKRPNEYVQIYYRAIMGFALGILSLFFFFAGIIWLANNFG